MSKAGVKFNVIKEQLMKDEEFKAEYEKLKPRYEVISQIIEVRNVQHITQEELALRAGTQKSNISRFESGSYNPSLDFLIKIAKSLGKEVHIEIRWKYRSRYGACKDTGGQRSVLQENGPSLREPYSKSLGDGIFELRAKVGSDISRVLYFFFYNQQIILTNGFIKKSNKIPRNEIEKAQKYRIEYVERKENKHEQF